MAACSQWTCNEWGGIGAGKAMQIVFLGTGAGAPTARRNVSAIVLQFDQGSSLWLFDCGEGTQQQFARAKLSLSRVSHIFISHLHGDHLFGLPGLLGSRSLQCGTTAELTVYGPQGIADYLRQCFAVTKTTLAYPLTIREFAEDGVLLETAAMTVTIAALCHRIASYGFALQEAPRSGRFRADLAAQHELPPGPLYGRLKAGEDVVLADGRKVMAQDYSGGQVPGRKVTILGDSAPCEQAKNLARASDVLIAESTFAHSEWQIAARSYHSTARQTAMLAQSADVRTLILTHVSARYQNADSADAADADAEAADDHPLLSEARAVFANTLLAHDFYRHQVSRRDPPTPDPYT